MGAQDVLLPAGNAVRGSNGAIVIGCEGSKACFEGEKLPEGLEEDSGRDSADRSIILGRLLTLGRQVVGGSELEYTSSDIWGQRVTTLDSPSLMSILRSKRDIKALTVGQSKQVGGICSYSHITRAPAHSQSSYISTTSSSITITEVAE